MSTDSHSFMPCPVCKGTGAVPLDERYAALEEHVAATLAALDAAMAAPPAEYTTPPQESRS
jgi:hypothetical protein